MVLDEISLQVRAGELVVVEGHRAAGKSSLARVAAVLRRPDVGEVWIGERDVSTLQETSLPYVRRNIGFFSADMPLLPRVTALENVMLAAGARGFEPAQAREPRAARARSRGRRRRGDARARDAVGRRAAPRRARARARGRAPAARHRRSLGGARRERRGRRPLSDPRRRRGGRRRAVYVTRWRVRDGRRARGGRRARLEGGRVLAGGGPIGVVASRRAPAEAPLVRVEAHR